MELRTRGLGEALLRELAGKPKWQRLKHYEKFAEMIDRHWDGNAAYCRLENKVSLGFVEGLNNKIRVISGAHTACATRTLYGSKSSPACCRSYSSGASTNGPDGGEQAGLLDQPDPR